MNRAPRWVVWAWLAFIIGCAVVVSRTRFDADLSAFLPRSPTPTQQILVEQLREGVVSRLILVGIEGDTVDALATVSKQLAVQLRQREEFVFVNNGEDVGQEKDRDFFWRHRYLLSPAVSEGHFSAEALHAELEERLQMLNSPVGMLLRRVLPSDPSGELLRLIEQFEGQSKPDMKEGVWFSRDGHRALMVVQTRAAGYDIDAQEQAQTTIRNAFSRSAAASQARLLLSGPGVFSVNSRASIKRDAWRFSMIATSLIAVMLLLLYRSPRVLGLGLLPVATGALAGVAAVSLGFGSVHGITLGFGVTLIGEGVDYAIYLFTQTAPGTAPHKTLERIWPTLRLGVLTSICGFSAMLLSGFPGLAQLGAFSIAGLVVAVIVTRFVLPGLTPTGFSPGGVRILLPYAVRVLQRAPLLRYPLTGLVVVSIALLALRHEPLWSDNLASLSPVSPAEQTLDQQLRANLGAPDVRFLVVIHAIDREQALQASERAATALQRLVSEKKLEGFESPATILPSRQTQRLRQQVLPDEDRLRANLAHAMQGLPFRSDVFEPFIRDVVAAKTAPLLDRASLNGTALAVKLDTLLVARPSGWMAMLPLRGVMDAGNINRALSGALGENSYVIDLKRESDDLYRTYRDQALYHSLLGAAAIIVLLMVSLRSLQRVYDVLAPLVAAVIVTTAAMTLTDGKLTIFHLVGMLLVVAVGSNYALFFERQAPAGGDRQRVMVSLVFAVLSTMIGFGLLAFSNVPVLHAIGATVGMGAVLSFLFAAVWSRRASTERIP